MKRIKFLALVAFLLGLRPVDVDPDACPCDPTCHEQCECECHQECDDERCLECHPDAPISPDEVIRFSEWLEKMPVRTDHERNNVPPAEPTPA